MPKRRHTELKCSPDGPWLTIRADQARATYNVRDLMRARMFEAGTGREKRLIGEWLKAREAKGKREPTKPPSPKNERPPAGPGRIPASRLIPPRSSKR